MNLNSLWRKGIALGMAALVTSASIGCSAFQPKMQTVRIDTVPTGADIRVNGENRGQAPVSVQLERNREHAIVATAGSSSAVRELNSKFSKTGILDGIGTFVFLFPGIGLFTPGAWELDSTNVVIQMPS